jgi:hypothetical protein
MSTLEETVAALQRRVEALETENAGLRRRVPDQLLVDQPTSRRTLLFGGAGVLGALAGGSLLTHTSVAAAAGAPHSEDRVSSLHISPTVMRSKGVYWAEHEWHLGPQFRGDGVPVVIATATDDYMHRDVTVQCTCSVRIEGTPGAYIAVIMVRGISSHARSVEVHAVAFGD